MNPTRGQISEAESIEIEHVVLLVHGIRDFGTKWMRSVSAALEDEHTRVIGTSFGYFDVFRFLSIFDFSNRPVKVIKKRIEDAHRNFTKGNRAPDISIICHSFGTYVVTKLLKDNPNMRIKNLILCGSVVDEQFEWAAIANQIGLSDVDKSQFIINDCAEDDFWPALGKAAGWRYGKGGVDGFRNAYVKDRFHSGNHNVFLEKEWAKKYWKPIILGEKIASAEIRNGTGTPESLPSWIRILAAFPLNWILFFLKITVLLLFCWYLYSALSPTVKPITVSQQEFIESLAKSENELEREGLSKRLMGKHESVKVSNWSFFVYESDTSSSLYRCGSTQHEPERTEHLIVNVYLKSGFRPELNEIVIDGIITEIGENGTMIQDAVLKD